MTKAQINLPKTAFSMKANLPTREPEILEYWKKIDLYDELRNESKGREKFVLHDGPPYANGNIHMGTALNKILKDIIVKFHQMDGKTLFMFQVGIVMACRLSGKLRNSIKKIKKTKTKFQQLSLEKNVEHLLRSGLKFTKANLKDWVLQGIGKIIIQQ